MNAYFAHHTLLHDITEGVNERAHVLSGDSSPLVVAAGIATAIITGVLLVVVAYAVIKKSK